ncbi:hypothetical protein J7K55_05690 [Candidatus Aerophobetes bacterium]|nr:hypothetical protein [Candidatus Aerophobetes bacterium]
MCNFFYYSIPHYVREKGLNTKVLFIHIPTQPKYRA